jgi:hypothetical protein
MNLGLTCCIGICLAAETRGWYCTGCGRNNSHISKGNYKQMVRGITKKFDFPNVDITKCFYFRISKLYRPNGGRDGRYTFGAVLLEWPPLVGPRTKDDV